MNMNTAHLADDRRPHLTACGEPWEDWQNPDQGAPLDEALAVPELTQVEKAEIRETARQPRGLIRQCQACLRVALHPPNEGERR